MKFSVQIILIILCCVGCRSTSSLMLDAEVKRIYTDDHRLYHLVRIVNAGHTDETVLTANNLYSFGGHGDEGSPFEIVYGLGLERQADKQGHLNVHRPYRCEPVTVHPGEFTNINTGESDVLERLNSKTGTVYVVFGYVVTEDWGKRLNIWHGKISSPVLKVDVSITNKVADQDHIP